MRAVLASLAILLLGGCLQPEVASTAAPPTPRPDQAFAVVGGNCDAYLLALAVDPVRTDPYLPPGFHLRDPADFLNLPATGQALVVAVTLLCGSGAVANRTVGPLQDTFAAIFVQPPSVPGERPRATYDFYETDHLLQDGPLASGLAGWGWTSLRANATAQPVSANGSPVQFTLTAAGRTTLLTFQGATPLPRDFGTSLVRLWRDLPAGIAHLDYTLPLAFGLGPGTCAVRPPTHVAAIAGNGPCPSILVGARQSFWFNATAVLEPGRHAG